MTEDEKKYPKRYVMGCEIPERGHDDISETGSVEYDPEKDVYRGAAEDLVKFALDQVAPDDISEPLVTALVSGEFEEIGTSVAEMKTVDQWKIGQLETEVNARKPPADFHVDDRPAKAHYSGSVQPIDLIVAQGLDFLEGNVIKYVTRYKRKEGVADLMKAKQYLEWLIDREMTRES